MSLPRRHKSLAMKCTQHGGMWRVKAPHVHIVNTSDDRIEAWWPCDVECGWHTLPLRDTPAARHARNDELHDNTEDARIVNYIGLGATWWDLSDLDQGWRLDVARIEQGVDLRGEEA